MAECEDRIAAEIMGHIQGLTHRQAKMLASLASERVYEVGQVIFQEGDPATHIHLLLEGCVHLGAALSRTSGLAVFASLGPSEFFGWSAVAHPRQRRTAFAEVIKRARVLTFPAQELLGLCDSDPVLGYVVMKCLATTIGNRLIATRERIMQMLR